MSSSLVHCGKTTRIPEKDQANRQKRIMDIKSAIVVKCRLQVDERLPFSQLIANYFHFLTSFGAGMENKSLHLGVVSWEVFNDLYENQYDLIRKIRFFVQAGQVEQNESLALEMVEDLLVNKQDELDKLRQKGLAERASLAAEGDLSHFHLLPAGNNDGGNKLMIPAQNQPRKKGAVWNWVKRFIGAGEQRP